MSMAVGMAAASCMYDMKQQSQVCRCISILACGMDGVGGSSWEGHPGEARLMVWGLASLS